MAAPKKTFDMEAVSQAAVVQVTALLKSGTKVTVEGVIASMLAAGSDIAPTRLAVLLKELSDTNRLGGFYLRRGRGFVHEEESPRTTKKVRKPKAKAKAKTKKVAVTPSTLAEEIDKQEEQAAMEEYRASRREHHRKALGLAS